ncbi:mitochondrial carrier domain-containing protein [Pavlovales sp. CCMP2436]|nr:mitochondrial carrier domain-containing protein [Pavlovales sp. CCMP2436]
MMGSASRLVALLLLGSIAGVMGVSSAADVGTIFVASCVGSVVQKLVLFPIDTLKTRAQHDRATHHPIHGARRAAKPAAGTSVAAGPRRQDLLRAVRDLYRGLAPALIGVIPVSLVYMPVYELACAAAAAHLAPAYLPVGRVLAGSLAGLACSVVHAPISVLKNRLQVAQYADLRTAFLAVVEADGIRGFYRGWASDASLEVLSATVSFVALDRLRALAPTGLPIAPWRNSAIGFAAGALTALCTEPLDVVKTRLTTQPLQPTSAAQSHGRGAKPSAGKAVRARKGRDGSDEYGGVRDALWQIARTEGTFALWRGLPQRVAYTALKGAIWYSVYQHTRVALGGALLRVAGLRV